MKFIFIFLFILFVLSFLSIKKTEKKLELFSWLFYSIVAFLSFIGINNLFLSFFKLNIDEKSLNLSLFVIIIFINILNIKIKDNSIHYDFQKYQVEWNILFSQIISIVFSLTFGLYFFTLDLIPSSMTGDPARHFQFLFDFDKGLTATAYKTIYYTFGSLFLYLFKGNFYFDKLFVLFNIVIFFMANNICSILFLKIVPNAKKHYIILCSILVCSGYSYFSLQYGYYTLLLSSVFLFSVVTLCLEYIDEKSTLKIYSIIALFVCAIALTHSYLLPEGFALLVFFSFWRENRLGHKGFLILKRYILFWIFIVFVGYVANIKLRPITEVLPERGFVNDDMIASLLIFAIFAAIYLVSTRREPVSEAVNIFLYCAFLFSLSMFFLMVKGISSPYYVNRNFIFLLPILTILAVAFIQKIENKFNLLSKTIMLLYYLFIITLYTNFDNKELSKSIITYSELKNDNKVIHYENARNASKSPLQMTKNDRDDFLKIRENKTFYFGVDIESIPVLGTDHETIWFGLYTNIYPSIFERTDGFVTKKLYFENFRIWKNDPSKRFIVLIKHHNFIDEKTVRYIESHSKVIIEGDSYRIMEKINFEES